MPGFFFRAPDAAPGEARPLVVVNNGSDGATSQMWVQGGAAASERGYHWMTFDGPGQQALLFEQGVPFRPGLGGRPDAVLDAMVARDGRRRRPDRRHRHQPGAASGCRARSPSSTASRPPSPTPASSTCPPPGWSRCPKSLRKELAEGKQEQFDRNMRIGERFARSATALLTFRGEPYGLHDDSRFRLYETVMRVPARRRGRADRHAAADHRSGGRAVLARPVPAALRPPARREGARPLHRRRRCRPPLRADGAGTARRARVRLARQVPGAPWLSQTRNPLRFASDGSFAWEAAARRDARGDRGQAIAAAHEARGAAREAPRARLEGASGGG